MTKSKYTKVPELSLKSYIDGDQKTRFEFIDALFDGLKYYGFIILKDHPVSDSLLKKCYSLSKELFSLDTETKRSFISSSGGGQRGYTAFGVEHAKGNDAPDLKEFWHVGRELQKGHKFDDLYPDNIWPDAKVADFKKTFLELFEALDRVGNIMLEALTKPLELDSNYFSDMIKDGNSILRLLHYPPIPENADPRCIRAAAHEDINLITILVAASSSGLELLDRDQKWLPVETQENNLIVDAGDMLSRITNEVIPSTTHRVVNPNDGTNNSRYSMPFFIHPHPEAMLTCIPSCEGSGKKYEDILAQDFLMQRLREIGLTK